MDVPETEGRSFEAVLDLLAGVRLRVRWRRPGAGPGGSWRWASTGAGLRRAGRAAGAGRDYGEQRRLPVAAGPVPDGHWYHDRRQGGRLLGEVCHFVDIAQALVGAPIEDVTALPGGGGAGVLHGDNVAVSLRFADSSLAVIASGGARNRFTARSGSRSRPGRTG